VGINTPEEKAQRKVDEYVSKMNRPLKENVHRLFDFLLENDLKGFEVPNRWPEPQRKGVHSTTEERATRRILLSLRTAYQKQKCQRCWALKRCCLCERLLEINSRHTVYVLVHPTEFLRSSNTGHLLLRSNGAKGRMLIVGVPKHQKVLESLLADPQTVILYPSDTSISIKELLDRSRHSASSTSPNITVKDRETKDGSEKKFCAAGTEDGPSFNIIVLDGTWSQVLFSCSRKGGTHSDTPKEKESM